MGDSIEEHGFFPDLQMTTDNLYSRLTDIVSKSETPQEEAEAALLSYAGYLSQMAVLPANCYKLDAAVLDIVAKCSCEDKDDAEADDEEDETVEKSDKEHTGHQKTNPAQEAVKEETEADKKKRAKNHPPAEMAPKDEDDNSRSRHRRK